jgi:hypothetical protein
MAAPARESRPEFKDRGRPIRSSERWGIDRLIPYAKNARTHTDAQVAAIAASIKEWGWTTPALVGEDGGLIAGHARILAARQLGIAEIPVIARHRRDPGDGRRGLERGAEAGLRARRQPAGDHRLGLGPCCRR